MIDIRGNKLEEFDIVAVNPPRYKGLILGHVVGFTAQKVRVFYAWNGFHGVSLFWPRDVSKQFGARAEALKEALPEWKIKQQIKYVI